MFKKVFLGLAVMMILCSSSFTVSFAQENGKAIESSKSNVMKPNWTEISQFSNTFDISSSGLATVESLLYAFDVDEISIVANLQQYKNGSWSTIKTWSKNSTDVYCGIGETWYLVSGYPYRLVTTGTVYEDGMQVEQTSYTSPSRYY